MTAKLTGRQGVEFICKALGIYGIDYVSADDFRLAKDNDGGVIDVWKKACVDILALSITDCKHSLVEPRDYESADIVLTEACEALSIPYAPDGGSLFLLSLFLFCLSQCGGRFMDGYRDLALAEEGFSSRLPRVDTYRSKVLSRAAAEQATAIGSKLGKIKSATSTQLVQVLRRREALKDQLVDLESEATKLAKRQGFSVGEWLRGRDQKGFELLEVDIAIQKEAIAEIAFWVWAESVPISIKPDALNKAKAVSIRKPPSKGPDLSSASRTIQDCISLVQDSGLHARNTHQFMTK